MGAGGTCRILRGVLAGNNLLIFCVVRIAGARLALANVDCTCLTVEFLV